jgi:hypothetical protein
VSQHGLVEGQLLVHYGAQFAADARGGEQVGGSSTPPSPARSSTWVAPSPRRRAPRSADDVVTSPAAAVTASRRFAALAIQAFQVSAELSS